MRLLLTLALFAAAALPAAAQSAPVSSSAGALTNVVQDYPRASKLGPVGGYMIAGYPSAGMPNVITASAEFHGSFTACTFVVETSQDLQKWNPTTAPITCPEDGAAPWKQVISDAKNRYFRFSVVSYVSSDPLAGLTTHFTRTSANK